MKPTPFVLSILALAGHALIGGTQARAAYESQPLKALVYETLKSMTTSAVINDHLTPTPLRARTPGLPEWTNALNHYSNAWIQRRLVHPNLGFGSDQSRTALSDQDLLKTHLQAVIQKIAGMPIGKASAFLASATRQQLQLTQAELSPSTGHRGHDGESSLSPSILPWLNETVKTGWWSLFVYVKPKNRPQELPSLAQWMRTYSNGLVNERYTFSVTHEDPAQAPGYIKIEATAHTTGLTDLFLAPGVDTLVEEEMAYEGVGR